MSNHSECFSKCHGEFTGEPGIPKAKNSDGGHVWGKTYHKDWTALLCQSSIEGGQE